MTTQEHTHGRGTPPARFIDTHVHLWDLPHSGMHYGWLDSPDDTGIGRISEIRFDLWDGNRYLDEVRHTRPEQVVHVQATDPPTDPAAETEWLLKQSKEFGIPNAIVGRADLRSDDLQSVLEAHRDVAPQFRGIRDMSTMGSIDAAALGTGLATLEQMGLSWEAACTWQEMGRVGELARKFPDLTIVLGHAGFPSERTDSYFADWSNTLRALADAPNVVCKVAGLGMSDHRWTTESWRPWITECIEAFGPNRCMFGSNWPIDRIYASYDAVVGAVAHIVSDLSASDSQDFWHRTASRVYNLENRKDLE
ncbi:amidohydrolase family protein [Rhodococcus wratislaviensis]|uniref:Amidohydrolase-related domain-containing protein n=1 Tax=Rhodococcus wratislaviensis NBRC 100605 TaxID=1219028 RepID=X0Q0J9_RHOWR|nr:amidohydrolase family protein [Rhodococcus wratislaviensis]GAF43676.1 hypothetical protein RW1_009_01000 [Rhodococcus wratislaviensis NBRC 100605]